MFAIDVPKAMKKQNSNNLLIKGIKLDKRQIDCFRGCERKMSIFQISVNHQMTLFLAGGRTARSIAATRTKDAGEQALPEAHASRRSRIVLYFEDQKSYAKMSLAPLIRLISGLFCFTIGVSVVMTTVDVTSWTIFSCRLFEQARAHPQIFSWVR